MRSTLRLSVLTVLLLTSSTSLVMASSTACRIAVIDRLHQAQGMVRRRVHHSAATLARWKIGAAAWSKAHGGKVYAGVPAPRHTDWKPLTFNCDDIIALDQTRPDEGLLIPGETLPAFDGFAMNAPGPLRLDLTGGTTPPLVAMAEWGGAPWFAPPPSGGFPGGSSPNGSVGAASFPPAPVPAPLVTPVPTPEPPTITLLATGLMSFLVTRLRRRTVV